MVKSIGLRSGVMEKRPVLELEDGNRRQRRPVKETHGFRKFFQTTAINAGMSPLYAEILMGHFSGGLALESYVRPSESDILEGNDKMMGYVAVLDALTIDENNKLKRKVQKLQAEQGEFDIYRKRIDEQLDKIVDILGLK